MCNQSITLFCKAGRDVFVRHVVHGVYLDAAQAQHSNKAAAGEMQNTDLATVYLPLENAAQYVAPAVWAVLPKAQQAQFFTLRPGDVFCAGVSVYQTPSQAMRAEECYVITTVFSKDMASRLAHFEIGGGSARRYGGGVT